MDAEKRARRQSRRVLISEVIMVFAVIVTVMILAFVVSGYWVGSDFKIERQGLLQIYSIPTGADISVDGSTTSWLNRTNTSKTLSAGEHTIVLTKEGYDSWSRTINITEGLLYRLHYPRLFLKNRESESALDFSGNFASVSPDRGTMLLANNTTTWQVFNLDSDSAKPTTLDLSKILPYSSLAPDATSGLFSGTIESVKWATDNEHILFKISADGSSSWVVLNIKNPANSVNLTKEFNADFSKIELLDSSASNLLAVLDGNLHRIDVGAKQISAVLVPDVASFDHYEQDLVFVAKSAVSASEPSESSGSSGAADSVDPAGSAGSTDSANSTGTTPSPYYVGSLRLGSSEITRLMPLENPAKVVTTKFYDDEYIGILNGAKFTLFLKKDFELKAEFDLSFTPSTIKIGPNGDFVAMSTGGHIASLDMEAMAVTEWHTGTDTFGWLDGDMVYAVGGGSLNIYDFNGLNQRTLASNVSSHFPVTIAADKYLYYFRDGSLIREWLIEH